VRQQSSASTGEGVVAIIALALARRRPHRLRCREGRRQGEISRTATARAKARGRRIEGHRGPRQGGDGDARGAARRSRGARAGRRRMAHRLRLRVPPAPIPATPVGEGLTWALAPLNGGATRLSVADVTAHFSKQFLAVVMPARALAASLEQTAAQQGRSLQGLRLPTQRVVGPQRRCADATHRAGRRRRPAPAPGRRQDSAPLRARRPLGRRPVRAALREQAPGPGQGHGAGRRGERALLRAAHRDAEEAVRWVDRGPSSGAGRQQHQRRALGAPSRAGTRFGATRRSVQPHSRGATSRRSVIACRAGVGVGAARAAHGRAARRGVPMRRLRVGCPRAQTGRGHVGPVGSVSREAR
jgi:hypothetical protein